MPVFYQGCVNFSSIKDEVDFNGDISGDEETAIDECENQCDEQKYKYTFVNLVDQVSSWNSFLKGVYTFCKIFPKISKANYASEYHNIISFFIKTYVSSFC